MGPLHNASPKNIWIQHHYIRLIRCLLYLVNMAYPADYGPLPNHQIRLIRLLIPAVLEHRHDEVVDLSSELLREPDLPFGLQAIAHGLLGSSNIPNCLYHARECVLIYSALLTLAPDDRKMQESLEMARKVLRNTEAALQRQQIQRENALLQQERDDALQPGRLMMRLCLALVSVVIWYKFVMYCHNERLPGPYAISTASWEEWERGRG